MFVTKRGLKTQLRKILSILMMLVLIYIYKGPEEVINKYKLFYLEPIIMFFMLIIFIRTLRSLWKTQIIVMWNSMSILLITLAFIIFYALLGFTLLTGEPFGEPSYDYEYIEWANFNTYTLFTDSNFPDIMLRQWKISN